MLRFIARAVVVAALALVALVPAAAQNRPIEQFLGPDGRTDRHLTASYTDGRGNAVYRDVLAAGKYLQSRRDADSTPVGIWGSTCTTSSL